MKCNHCGFISAKNFYRCPYCGHIHKDENNLLDFTIRIKNFFSIRLKTLILLIFVNLWAVTFFVDLFLGFRFSISYWSFIVISIAYVSTAFIIGKSPIVSAVEKIDIAIFVGLLIGIFAFKIDGLFDFRLYFPTLIIPIFTIIEALVTPFLLIFRKEGKFRPLWTEVLLILHFVAVLTIYILFVIGKYLPADAWLHTHLVLDGTLGVIENVVIYIALGASLLYLVNYNIALISRIMRELKVQYGGDEKD